MKKRNLKISNDFVNSIITKNNSNTLKILFYCVLNGKIDKGIELDTITIDIRAIKGVLGLDFKNLRQNLQKIQKTLITIKNPNKDITDISLIPKIDYIYDKQELKLKVFPVVLQELKELKNRFTIIDVNNLINLENKHSIRLLTILENIDSYGENYGKVKYFSKDELNELFDTNYKGIKEIERAILKPIKEELDQYSKLTFIYDLVFDLDNPSRGRKPIKGVKIYLKDNKTRQLRLF